MNFVHFDAFKKDKKTNKVKLHNITMKQKVHSTDNQKMHEIFCQRKNFFVRGRNILLEEKTLDGGRNFFSEKKKLSEVEISCQRKKFIVGGRNFILEDKIYCQSNKFFFEEEILCQRKELPVRGRNFLSEVENSCERKICLVRGKNFVSKEKSNITGRNFLWQDSTSYYWVNI